MVPYLTLVGEGLNQNSTKRALAPAGWKGKGMVPYLTLVGEGLNQNSTKRALAPAGWKGKGWYCGGSIF